jgi:Periplasmic binding protein
MSSAIKLRVLSAVVAAIAVFPHKLFGTAITSQLTTGTAAATANPATTKVNASPTKPTVESKGAVPPKPAALTKDAPSAKDAAAPKPAMATSQPPAEKTVTAPAAADPVKDSTAAKVAANTKAQDDCVKLFNRFAVPLQGLWSQRGVELRGENTDGTALIEDFTTDHCQDAETRTPLISLLAKTLNAHSGKIGVILPLAGNNYLRHMISAFEANIRSRNLDPKKILVVIDNQGKDALTHQAVASLIFEHKVSVIIGGTQPNDATILKQWATKLMVPTFLMSEPPPGPPLPNVFYAHPTQKSLARTAVNANIRYGHRRISILSPSDQHSDKFIAAYEEAAKAASITLIGRVPYDSKRFDMMESAARKIFNLDTTGRQDELKALYRAAKDQAKAKGEKFNPNMVALQPDIRQDAVMIPDTSKIVRHFAKIFGYLGVRKMPLFGHFEWRSPGLVSPWDSFLIGSYFVDFQGLYTSLPAPIKISTQSSPFFIAPDKTEQADFSLVAFRAIEWPIRLSLKTTEMRRKLDKVIPKIKDDLTEGNYDSQNTIIWAPSIFSVIGNGASKGTLNLVGQ